MLNEIVDPRDVKVVLGHDNFHLFFPVEYGKGQKNEPWVVKKTGLVTQWILAKARNCTDRNNLLGQRSRSVSPLKTNHVQHCRGSCHRYQQRVSLDRFADSAAVVPFCTQETGGFRGKQNRWNPGRFYSRPMETCKRNAESSSHWYSRCDSVSVAGNRVAYRATLASGTSGHQAKTISRTRWCRDYLFESNSGVCYRLDKVQWLQKITHIDSLLFESQK